MSRSRTCLSAILFAFAILPLTSAPARSASQTPDGTWSALDPSATAPSVRRDYAAIYDAVNQRYLVFAGFYGDNWGAYQLFNEVWTLSLGPTPTWSHVKISGPTPGERHAPQWGYDPARNRVLVFGGYGRHYPGNEYAYLNDVWELSLDGTPAWTELHPSGTPPSGRLAGCAVYDLLRQRFVGFGGTVGQPVDTWTLDLSGDPAWTTVETDSTSSSGPKGGYGMASIYDPVRDRMIIFGGSTSDDYFGVHNDTWELSLVGDTPAWRKLEPLGPLPLARRSMTSIYDPLRDRMIVFAGWDGTKTSTFLNDTWALSLSPLGDLQWTELEPDGEVPVGRDAIAAAYDPLGDRMVVFGGWSGTDMLNDTQFLSWGGVGQAASVTASTEANPGFARIEWSIKNSTGPRAGVYRREPGTPWSSIATVHADASGVIIFEDHTVTSGRRYGYMIAVPSQLGETFAGEAWVDVPATSDVGGVPTVLALRRVQPNPVVDRFVVTFDLPSGAPALLELVDVTGRRVFSSEVGALGAGTHQVEIDSALSPGMYFLRLAQSGRSLRERVVVMGR